MKQIIMAGGSGSRLWPLSRTNYPKQFLKLSDMDKSIFQATVERCLLMGSIEDLYIVTAYEYLHLIQGQIQEIGRTIPRGNILLESEPKNTLPAILCAVQAIMETGEHVCAVFASDHVIEPAEAFAETVLEAAKLAEKGFVTFGIKPTEPETGYGYIKPGEAVLGGFLVSEFKEKPDLNTALEYVEAGYYWNSGIFMFSSSRFYEAVKEHSPDVFEAFQSPDMDERFRKSPSISIDYGLMEKLDREKEPIYCVPLSVNWNDLGNFNTFYDKYVNYRDKDGNIYFNNEILINCENNMVYTDSGKAVALIGISDAVVVDQKDALLICHKDQTQAVKDVVGILREKKDQRADYHLIEYRPWGSFTILENSDFYKVKRLSVMPGKRLSYQMHYHRSEHWIVASGTATVIIDDEEKLVRSGESIFIRSGQRHRLINLGKLPLEVIEVQSGEYLGEDDIVRFDDDFERVGG